MIQVQTDDACKQIIKYLAGKLNIDAKLIATRLLDEDSKADMRLGLFPIASLQRHIEVWRDSGMPDLVTLHKQKD
jgi:hypothetical protein